MFSLRVKYPVEIAMITATLRTICQQRPQRTGCFTGLGLPEQAITCPGRAHKFLCIFQHPVTITVLLGIFHLCIVVGQHSLHGVELIPADLPNAHAVTAFFNIKVPTRCPRHDWNRQGPFAFTDGNQHLLLTLRQQGILLFPGRNEIINIFTIDVIQWQYLAVICTQYLTEHFYIIIDKCQGQCIRRFLGHGKNGLTKDGVNIQFSGRLIRIRTRYSAQDRACGQ